MAGFQINAGGAWRKAKGAQVYAGGAWRKAKAIWVNSGGSWRRVSFSIEAVLRVGSGRVNDNPVELLAGYGRGITGTLTPELLPDLGYIYALGAYDFSPEEIVFRSQQAHGPLRLTLPGLAPIEIPAAGADSEVNLRLPYNIYNYFTQRLQQNLNIVIEPLS